MKEKTFTISDKSGIHIKPAQMLVKKAMEFADTNVTVCKDGQEANAKSMISLLGLELSYKSKITFKVEGGNEDECLAGLESILETESLI